MSFAKYDEYTSPLFKKLNILKFPDLIIFHNSFFMYDYFTGKLHMYSMLFFTKINKIHNYNTRPASKQSYYIPPARTNYGKCSLRFNGADLELNRWILQAIF